MPNPIFDRLFAPLAERPAAFLKLPDGGTVSGDAFLAMVHRSASALRALGVRPGDRVAAQVAKTPEALALYGASIAAGAVFLPLNTAYTAAEVDYFVGDATPRVLLADPAKAGALAPIAAKHGARLATLDAQGRGDFRALCDAQPDHGDVAERDPDDLAALLYTSGTTGRPKGCILPNRYFLMAGRWYAGIGGLAQLKVGIDRMLTPLPLVHMNAMAYSALAMVTTGGCLVLLDRFHPATWWASVRESRATVVHYLGVMPAMLMKAAPSAHDREHAVRFGFGAGVDRSLHAGFEQRFGFPLLEAWAMTETGAGAVVIANREPRRIGTSCFGREEPEVEVKLVAEGGGEPAVDEPGELLVRHAGDDPRDGFFAGYLKDEAATDEAWAGGWFHTGDIVRRGADGQLHFVDRRKNVIRRSGENISAVEVESVLLQHPRVRTAAVAAVPDAVRGDEVLACIVADGIADDAEARRAAAQDIVQWCLDRLAYYKAPGYVAFVEALPLTASQKVQRGELKALAASLVGQPHCIATGAMKKRAG